MEKLKVKRDYIFFSLRFNSSLAAGWKSVLAKDSLVFSYQRSSCYLRDQNSIKSISLKFFLILSINYPIYIYKVNAGKSRKLRSS